MAETKKQRHFVLVHGACHGAWCWYKLKPRLEAAGHRVTALDLAASGVNTKKAIKDVRTFEEYSEPLLEVMASLSPDEKVILVGHSLGGLSLAVAADKFRDKISVAIFLTAFMPDTTHQPSYVLEQYLEQIAREGHWLDTQFSACDPSNPSHISMLFGHDFTTLKLYQLCPPEHNVEFGELDIRHIPKPTQAFDDKKMEPEQCRVLGTRLYYCRVPSTRQCTDDLELAKTLLRPGSMFVSDLSKACKFSNEGYGSVKRAYVVCQEDIGMPKQFQHWMIQNHPVDEVLEIKGADHMAMLSEPQLLYDCLSLIAPKYD